MMIAGSILVGRALAPVEVLIANWKQLVSARAAYQRLTELLRVYPARVAGMPLATTAWAMCWWRTRRPPRREARC
jgi:ATP-binding cassette subfamily C exporter for protease/lipase